MRETHSSILNIHIEQQMMKMMNTFLLTILLGSLFFVPSAFAQRAAFTIDGHKVEIFFHQKKNVLEVSGVISKGLKKCKQLNVDILFDNRRESSQARIHSTIQNYQPRTGGKFSGQDKVYADKQARTNWYVSNVNLKCMK